MTADVERLKLVVAVDFSESSRRALDWAFDYAARVPCEVHLVHVVADKGATVPEMEADIERVTHEVEEELFAMLRTPEERSRVLPLHRNIVMGKPAQAILRFASDLGAETIVIGTHGHGKALLRLGSVAEAVVHGAQCPVVCVKAAVKAATED